MILWVIYDHPKDLPYWYVARRREDNQPTQKKLLAHDLGFLRQRLAARGLVRIFRSESGDPVIVESWV